MSDVSQDSPVSMETVLSDDRASWFRGGAVGRDPYKTLKSEDWLADVRKSGMITQQAKDHAIEWLHDLEFVINENKNKSGDTLIAQAGKSLDILKSDRVSLVKTMSDWGLGKEEILKRWDEIQRARKKQDIKVGEVTSV